MMKRLAFRVETLRCEANEADVLDDLLAHEGVIAAELNFDDEMVAVSYDAGKTTKAALIDHLRFFGIVQAAATPVA